MVLTATFERAGESTAWFQSYNPAGYRISLALTPQVGFSGHFYVYLMERADAGRALQPLEVASGGERLRGKLRITDEERDYVLDNIDLTSVQVSVSRQQKQRWIEFTYDPAVTDDKKLPITIAKKGERRLENSHLGSAYAYQLDDDPENLYGVSARFSGADANIVRLHTAGCASNSWLHKALQAHGGDLGFQNITCQIPDNDFEATTGNLIRLYVEESYGELIDFPTPSIEALLNATPAQAATLPRLRIDALSAGDHVRHQQQSHFHPVCAYQTLETATLHFDQGHNGNLQFV
ncbi:MAG: hypothetical protein GY711_15095 [bacterium]|nr:hypothetical protein [bacterium]